MNDLELVVGDGTIAAWSWDGTVLSIVGPPGTPGVFVRFAAFSDMVEFVYDSIRSVTDRGIVHGWMPGTNPEGDPE